ncbi:MAG: hypothetical protein M1829_006056 [Trizodia sp. TS-e1964]|nr:MAG: hypothetical protein M1829_006056 [Trizodia sp. TS-e1964]
MSPPFARERLVAEQAVARASVFAQQIFKEKSKGAITKEDRSPVTIGDFGAQAIIIGAIHKNFPLDEIIGEEDSNELRVNEGLRNEIWRYIQKTQSSDTEADSILGGSLKSLEEMLDMIDLGKSEGGPKGRMWVLDPIDGTKGFLRGDQYAVCLSLLVDGEPVLGVLGCPNLPSDRTAPILANVTDEQRGVLVSAARGEGASSRPLQRGKLDLLHPGQPISMNHITSPVDAVFCEGVEAAHSSQPQNAEIAQLLGSSGRKVRLDSQAKYASLARGTADIYLRLPVLKGYTEAVWDHAAGDLIVREAGGVVTDAYGQRLNFSVGRRLSKNVGVVASAKAIHGEVLAAVARVLSKAA